MAIKRLRTFFIANGLVQKSSGCSSIIELTSDSLVSVLKNINTVVLVTWPLNFSSSKR